jgi:hypothetical protein
MQPTMHCLVSVLICRPVGWSERTGTQSWPVSAAGVASERTTCSFHEVDEFKMSGWKLVTYASHHTVPHAEI